mgnify:CR=1 FL=1
MSEVIMRPSLLKEKLKQLRKEFGYSYKKLEELTGISRSSLQRYESNPCADIPLNKLSIIAEVYKVTISYLLGHETKDKKMSESKPYDTYVCDMNNLGSIQCIAIAKTETAKNDLLKRDYQVLFSPEDADINCWILSRDKSEVS